MKLHHRKRKRKRGPMTRGRALIEARSILGPSAHVRPFPEAEPGGYTVGIFDDRGFVPVTQARSWRGALALARDSAEAKAWRLHHQAEWGFVRRLRHHWRAFYAAAKAGASDRNELRRVLARVLN